MTIRVGIDGSGPSRAALFWALRRALHLSQPVVLMHVLDLNAGPDDEEYVRVKETDGARILDQAMNSALTHTPGCDVTSQLVHGSVGWSLVQGLATEDVVVVGTHKTGYLRGRVSGTRSIVVASFASCSVAVIPDMDLSGRRGVVVGVAEGDAWSDIVGVGAREAARTGEELSLIHATPDTPSASSGPGKDLLIAASALAAEITPETNIRHRISRQEPAAALLDASHASALLVLGVRRRDRGHIGSVGSVTHDVLMNINAPVLIAH